MGSVGDGISTAGFVYKYFIVYDWLHMREVFLIVLLGTCKTHDLSIGAQGRRCEDAATRGQQTLILTA